MTTSANLITFNPDELRTKEFNKFIDDLMVKGRVEDEQFHNLTKTQKEMYSVINRAFERHKRNNV